MHESWLEKLKPCEKGSKANLDLVARLAKPIFRTSQVATQGSDYSACSLPVRVIQRNARLFLPNVDERTQTIMCKNKFERHDDDVLSTFTVAKQTRVALA